MKLIAYPVVTSYVMESTVPEFVSNATTGDAGDAGAGVVRQKPKHMHARSAMTWSLMKA
jgi:hypothetical protein